MRFALGVVFVHTAAGYTYVEGSGDKADKSACLNTTNIIAIQ